MRYYITNNSDALLYVILSKLLTFVELILFQSVYNLKFYNNITNQISKFQFGR
jgi:hypothetical protein